MEKLVPKQYANVWSKQENIQERQELVQMDFSNIDDYLVVNTIGRGKFAQVFLAIEKKTGKKRVLKILKPGSRRKMTKEIVILRLVQNQNVQEYISCINNPIKNIFTLVTDFYEADNFENYFKLFTVQTLKVYMKQLLSTLDYIHSKGIIHRDIKPQNILYKFEEQKMRIIDFGQAEFYVPNQDMSPRVASRFYKAPELAIKFNKYHYSVDVWAAGIIFASIVIQKDILKTPLYFK